MILNVYAVRDQKTRNFLEPMLSQNNETAIRTFQRLLPQVPTMTDFPEDYDLYEIGGFDTSSGKLIPKEVVQKIANGLDFSHVQNGVKSNGQLHESQTKIGDETPV